MEAVSLDADGQGLVGGGGQPAQGGEEGVTGHVGFAHSFSMEGKTHHEFVVGTWVTVELGKDTGLDWRLIHERVMMKPSRDAMLRRESGLRRAVGFGPGWMEDGTWFALRPEGKPGAVLHPAGAEAHRPPQPALPAQHGVPGRLHHHPLVDEPPVQPGVLPQLHRHPGAHHELVVGFPLHGEGMGKPDVPGDAFLAALRRLSAATDKPLAVCVQGDRLHVFVTNRILGQKVSSRVPPSAAVAEVDFLPELDGILKASDALV